MNLGEKINELRKKNHMTQEAIADYLHVSSQAVSKWERGVSNPDLELIPVLAELFSVSADELLGLSVTDEKKKKDVNYDIERRLNYIESILRVIMTGDENEALALSLEKSNPIAQFDFSSMTEDEKSHWNIAHGERLESDKKIIFRSVPFKQVVGTCIDPQLVNEKLELDINGVNRIYIRLNTISNDATANLQMFFKTKEHPVWDERKSLTYQYRTNSVTEINIGFSNPCWYGTLTGLRIDTTSRAAEMCSVEQIALIDSVGEVRYVYDFTQNKDLTNSDWKLINATILGYGTALTYRVGVVNRTKNVYDPQLLNNDLSLDLRKSKYVHLRLRTDLDNIITRNYTIKGIFYNAYLKVYFKTESSNAYSEQKQVRAYYVAGSGTVDVYADMSKNGFWNGILTGLRIDPIEEYDFGAKFEIELVEILESSSKISGNSLFTSLEGRIANIEEELDYLNCQLLMLSSEIEDSE